MSEICSIYGDAPYPLIVIRASHGDGSPHHVQRRPHADVVVTQSAAVLELPALVDDALLVRREALLVLDLLLHGVDRVRRLDVERDRLVKKFRDNLHIGKQSH